MFFWVGLSLEILTVQGMNFISQVLQQVWALLKVKPLQISVYHPRKDGLVEWFNKTLKSMLRFVGTEAKEGDQLLLYLLLAL